MKLYRIGHMPTTLDGRVVNARASCAGGLLKSRAGQFWRSVVNGFPPL